MNGDYIFEPSENPRVRVPLPHSTPKKEKRPFSTVLVEVAGKQGHKQLITVLGDAPDENKELKGLRLAIAPRNDYIFEPSENPRVRVPFATFDPKKRKKTVLDGLGRSGGTRTHGLQYPKLARYQLRYTSLIIIFLL